MYFTRYNSERKTLRSPLTTMPAASFRSRYHDAVIQPNDEAMEIVAAHEKCPKVKFQWAGEFETTNEAGEYVQCYIAGDGPLQSETSLVVILEK
jgi:hypothetical protein